MTTDLIIPIKVETKELFTKIGVSEIVKAVDKKITEFNCTSTETKKDRDKIRSFAAKVVKTKTFLEKKGKEFVADKKAAIKIFDTSRKELRDTLAEKAAKVRKPLTDFEQAERIRIEDERQLEIFNMDYEDALGMNDLINREKALAEKAAEIAGKELARQQKEEKERLKKEQKEREERLKKEAVEQAKRESEAKIKFEKDEKERIEREAKEAAEQAEKDRIAAEERAKIEKEIAIQKAKDEANAEAQRKEQQRLDSEREEAAKKQVEQKAAEKKAANKRHQASINNKILDAFSVLDISQDIAKKVVIAVCKGEIPNMTIQY